VKAGAFFKSFTQTIFMTQNTNSWTENENKLSKTFTFGDFKSALVFVNKVGEIAESLGHHPEIWFTWGKVTITSTSHDDGNIITDKDRELTQKIDLI
jgi:4a-hydroxytetrahydrobiopterin dehydratase